ncbi:triple tyrosine motif-containing protein [Rhodanobacter ginsengiterrae]|uniref:sensor histidine kinase n=1 Tax=Rhodanobacter ginsengiterrae TaxID=2008451 RepID=UPI003CF704A2
MALALAMLATASLRAFAAAETLGSFQHTSNRAAEGAPGYISRLAQTTDGFLWMAGPKGLVRFDGVQFQAFKPLPGERFMEAQLGMLFPAEGGGLWIQNDTAGPTLLKDGHLFQFGEKQGYVGVGATFFEDPHGTVWAVSDTAVMYFRAGAWHADPHGPKGASAFSSGAVDAAGNVWVAATGQGMLVRPAGLTQWVNAHPGTRYMRLYGGPSGRFYLAERTGLSVYRTDGIKLVQVMPPIPLVVISAVETHSGALWLTSTDFVVHYISPQALRLAEQTHSVPHMEVVPDLPGSPWPLLEDRNGNVWIGGNGLDGFSHAAFTAVALPASVHEVSPSLDRSGDLWIGSDTLGVLHVGPQVPGWEITDVPQYTLATYSDPTDGSVWGANTVGVWQLSPGKPRLVVSFPPPNPGPAPHSMARDAEGTLFVARARVGSGLAAWNGKSWRDVLSEPTVVKVMAVDRHDRLWLGSLKRNRLIELSRGVERIWDERQNLRVGAVRSILVDGELLWVGGDEGIQFFDGKHFTSLTSTDPDAFQTVTGLVRDAAGDLWVQTLEGVSRIPATDIARARSQPGTPVTYRSFTTGDGVPGTPDADRTLPSLRLSDDGRIWTHAIGGLAWIDPVHMRKDPPLPPVVVETVSSGTATYQPSDRRIDLTAAQSSFRITYSTPALTHPERVRFAYRLAGFDDWQDAGTRREAVFTKVPAGRYQFQVRAMREGDAATALSAPLTLIRAPAYYETWWFRVLALLPLAIVLWLAYVLRMRALRRQMHIRVDERERIARDLHDTLLQGVQGLQLRLQTWAASPRLEPAHRQEMADVAVRARDMLIDGRDRIIALRRVEASADLAGDLRAIALDYTTLYRAGFSLTEEGASRPLIPEAAQEILDITREGLRNAFVHANASSVALCMQWRRDGLHVLVRDDGDGIDETVLRDGGRAGHWGLQGMRERAEKIGARLLLRRGDENGTEVSLVVPARAAYASARLWWRLRGIRQAGPDQAPD